MPILPENKKLYPPDWKEISHRIRFERAKGKCEWCGVQHGAIGYRKPDGTFVRELDDDGKLIERENMDELDVEQLPHPFKIILTTAHLNHDPTDNRDENLAALCQQCHNRYDAPHRAETRKQRREAKQNQGPMFGE